MMPHAMSGGANRISSKVVTELEGSIATRGAWRVQGMLSSAGGHSKDDSRALTTVAN
jgi:hypothetical protein